MNENAKISGLYSWPVIILALCIFWPVGIFLIIRRVSIDKKAALGAGKLIAGIGIASYRIAGIGILACLSEGFASDDIVLILFFGIAGFALRKVAKKIKVEAEKVRHYLSIIINGNIRQLDTIASTTGKSYDVVHKDIKNMIDKGYFKNAYIDENAREIVIPGSSPVPQNNVYSIAANPTPVQTRMVACPCCGANNTISGNMGECEYCGSALNTK